MPVAAGKLSLALSLCLCAGQLVSAPAASAATAPVTRTVATTAVTSAAAVATRVSITRNKSTVALGSPVVITARVVDPRTGKAVSGGTMRLQAWRNGRWNDWQ
ncbi:MAG TPA: peptidase, partial [Catenuloplanes sp.]